jgi:FKBP-type peptidyl-prolyl cis-trans isomerase
MKTLFKATLAVGAIALLVACGNYDYKKTPSGVMYKIVSRGTQPVKPGQWLKVHYKGSIGDSVMFDTYGAMPAFGMYDTSAKDVHDFLDFLGEMKVGDSAVFVRSVDTLQKKGFLMYNDVFKKGATIKGYITILKVYANRDQMQIDQKAEADKLKAAQTAALEDYLKKENVTGYIKTPKGAFVKVETEGTGAKADSGSAVTVNYTGRLKNGNAFDSNVDTAFGHVQPFEFQVGTGSVIEGWDDGIRYFREGGKGKIYVPSMLGYGGNAQGEKLPAYSDLIFDIQIIKVKPQVAAPMPQQ